MGVEKTPKLGSMDPDDWLCFRVLARHKSVADNNTPQGYFSTESSAVEDCKMMADNPAFTCFFLSLHVLSCGWLPGCVGRFCVD